MPAELLAALLALCPVWAPPRLEVLAAELVRDRAAA